jgi:hypothetical protein
MTFNNLHRGISAGLVLTLALPSAFAESITIRSNTIVPVVMEDELSFKDSREGDRFFARVDDDRDLPYRTRLEGRIINIERQRDDRPAYMDVEFNTILLPDGTSQRITAVPISLDSKYVSRSRDGRLTAKKGALKKDHYVLGGVVGGFILGSILGRKQFEGAFVGAIAGIIMAETQGKQEEVALKRNTRVGALFEKDVRIEFNGEWRRDGRIDDRDNGRYDDRNDRRNDGYGSDSYNGRRDDRYGNHDENLIRIEFDGRELRFGSADRPYRNGDAVMVPLDRTASQMGIDIESTDRTILLEDEDSILKLEQDSSDYRLNGKRGSLSRAVVKRGSTVYVPLEVLAKMKREAITVNGEKLQAVRIKN